MSECSEIRCSNCKHWQGNKLMHDGDCYRVLATLCWSLFQCADENGNPFSIPFDPHSAKYFDHDSAFWGMYRGIKRRHLPIGVTMENVKERDLYFPQVDSIDMLDQALAEPKVGSATLKFFKTEYNFKCELHEWR